MSELEKRILFKLERGIIDEEVRNNMDLAIKVLERITIKTLRAERELRQEIKIGIAKPLNIAVEYKSN